MEGNRLTDENGKPIVPVARDDPYSWVKGEVREIASWFSDVESVAELGDPLLWVREGRDIKLQFVPCSSGDRVFHKGEGWAYFYMYTTLFIDLGVRFPVSQFECGVLSQMKCAPTQIHPNAWGFIRAFEVLMDYLGQEPLLEAKGVRKGGLVTLNGCQGRTLFMLYKSSYKDFKAMYVKVTSPEEEFPFYVDECLLERFPLYWYSEPVQILGMNEVDEKSAMVIDFLDQYVCTREPLSVNKLVRWEKEKEFVSEYLETTTEGLKNFFKMKSERELSTSNVVKSEQGVVKRVISVKRRRAEGEASGKSKVIDLTTARCCGKEDLSSVWSEHYPLPILAEEHFQSKVYAARLLCLGRYEELEAKREAERRREKTVELEKDMEKKVRRMEEEVAQKEKSLLEAQNENLLLKEKVSKLEKDKTDLELRVVELCGQKKDAETSKENHGYDMLLVGFERAKRQAEFFFPQLEFDKLDPIKVVHNGALVDDDEVDAEGGGDHDLEV
ncbi:hypothetical protein PIB30_095508 [Stylosanthes scabra]|uniref:Transposase (Putative), gypsy type n=1 Tax=Stylosanthes scabra TaxID=79078 RepID=A0ABU6YWC0_9FABA|nr:hypothetical protein [Stylosanthes scabra]